MQCVVALMGFGVLGLAALHVRFAQQSTRGQRPHDGYKKSVVGPACFAAEMVVIYMAFRNGTRISME